MSTLQKIRQRVREQEYVMRWHMREKMASLDLTLLDVENAIFSGYIAKRKSDPRGTQHIVEGPTLDNRNIRIPIYLQAGKAILVTVYEEV